MVSQIWYTHNSPQTSSVITWATGLVTNVGSQTGLQGGGYTGYKTSSQECPAYHNDICGNYIGRATLYEKTKFKNYISYDMRFAYKQPIFNNQSLDII